MSERSIALKSIRERRYNLFGLIRLWLIHQHREKKKMGQWSKPSRDSAQKGTDAIDPDRNRRAFRRIPTDTRAEWRYRSSERRSMTRKRGRSGVTWRPVHAFCICLPAHTVWSPLSPTTRPQRCSLGINGSRLHAWLAVPQPLSPLPAPAITSFECSGSWFCAC